MGPNQWDEDDDIPGSFTGIRSTTVAPDPSDNEDGDDDDDDPLTDEANPYGFNGIR